ncbi:hypothetical protein VUR80DRAFT_8173 [Thermomyces stellatus]
MSYYSYSDDDEYDILDQPRSPSVQYVEVPGHQQRHRPRSYYAREPSPAFFDRGRSVVEARSRERDRFRGRRASSPPAVAPAPAPAPVVIHNSIYHEYSSDEDDRRHLQLTRRRRSRSRSRSRSSPHIMTRQEDEMDRTRRELAQLRMSKEAEERHAREQEEAELRRAKKELDEIKQMKAKEEHEKQIKKELEYQRLKNEERVAEEKKRREKEAEEAVERYKQEELERIAKEKEEAERREEEYKRRMKEHLYQSGLDEEAVAAIMENKKLPEAKADKPAQTHTRMARKHLSLETLRAFNIDYTLDEDPEYILIKRLVPEWEQDTLWKHTKLVRERRSKLILNVDDKKHRHRHRHSLNSDAEFEWVRKKSPRRRSKSPGLLMYLAGAKPA